MHHAYKVHIVREVWPMVRCTRTFNILRFAAIRKPLAGFTVNFKMVAKDPRFQKGPSSHVGHVLVGSVCEHVCKSACMHAYMHACEMWAYKYTSINMNISISIHKYIYIHIYICVCVYVCVYVNE